MQNKILTIYDCKAEAYGRPFVARSTGEGLRSFTDEVNSGREDSQLSNHPEDFTLFEVGTFDDAKGEIFFTMPKRVLLVVLM